MRKLWLTFTAMLLCSIASFAQTEIWTASGFRDSVGTSGNYKLMADINLGTYATDNNFVKSSFSGTFDGNNNTITYNGSFTATDNAKIALFRTVSGTIKNLNLDADITVTGGGSDIRVGLLCGEFQRNTTAETVIEFCNVMGNINSTVQAGTIGHSSTGLIIGSNLDTLRYCTGHGNVTGVGYVGGLVGSMGTLRAGLDNNEKPLIKGCYFTGNVTANNSSTQAADVLAGIINGISGLVGGATDMELQSFGGGICGTMRNPAKIELCVAEAIIVVGQNAAGITTTSFGEYFLGWGACGTAQSNYATGTINGTSIGSGDLVDQVISSTNNPAPNNSPNYPTNSVTNLQTIVDNLNTKRGSDNNFYFALINGKVVLIVGEEEQTGNSELYISNISITKAKATWTKFNYQTKAYKIDIKKDGSSLDGYPKTITNTSTLTNNFTNLDAETTYKVILKQYSNQNANDNSIQDTKEVEFTTISSSFETAKTGLFNSDDTWSGGKAPDNSEPAIITINAGHVVTVNHDLKITGDYYIENNNGVLQITQGGQLINTTSTNVQGIVEIVSPHKEMNKWTFIGAPFEDNYKLGTIYPMSQDISVSEYDYSTANWSESWAHVGTQMEAGEGYFAWPFYSGAVIFTTYGDVWNYEEGKVGEYDFNRDTTATKLNNANEITVTARKEGFNGGWMAVANPYPAKLSVSKFIAANTDIASGTEGNIQGQCIYKITNNVSNNQQTWDVVFANTNETVKDIAMTEGFFVNLASGNSVTFAKNQLTANNQAKSQVAPREFVELSLVKGNYNSKLYFAHNQEAEQNYDIFDANKLFALGEVAEPYFVTDGIALVKEEAKELPYYATMNVRSFANDTVSFVVNNIPEGLAVSIIDGEEVIDMVEGGVYTTEILTGENADRFKVLIKKSVSISDVEELEVNITNNNRHISIETTETDLQVEVYNALGQKVLSTKDRNFTLNQVSAGAYLIKAFNNKASKTQKIVVE